MGDGSYRPFPAPPPNTPATTPAAGTLQRLSSLEAATVAFDDVVEDGDGDGDGGGVSTRGRGRGATTWGVLPPAATLSPTSWAADSFTTVRLSRRGMSRR